MKIQQPRQAWEGKSHKELESFIHSNPRQELGMKDLGESEFWLLEWRMGTVSIVECESQEIRVIEAEGVYIDLSQETSCWAHIQISDNVRLELSVAGGGFLG
jgi:hypothetical protein